MKISRRWGTFFDKLQSVLSATLRNGILFILEMLHLFPNKVNKQHGFSICLVSGMSKANAGCRSRRDCTNRHTAAGSEVAGSRRTG